MSIVEAPPRSRAERFRDATHEAHERLDSGIIAARPFASRERYRLFVEMQYRFTAVVHPLYHERALGGLLPGLPERSRYEAARLDLIDLGGPVPDVSPVLIGPREAIGWLYVAEGSTLGAAFLLKEAAKLGFSENLGARHLAAHPEGRGLHWRRFKDGLNAIPLSQTEDAEAVAGAVAAFDHVAGVAAMVLGGLESATADSG